MNVSNYLRRKRFELETTDEPEKTDIAKEAINVNDKIRSLVSILESEIDKVRDPDNAIQVHQGELFIRMIRELKAVIELTAEIQGKLQPSITIAMFNKSIDGFVTMISNCEKLTPEAKQIVVNMAADSLCNVDVLKPVKGKDLK